MSEEKKPETIAVELTKEEIIALRRLLNEAVKSAGIGVAQACLFLDRRLGEALPKEEASDTPNSEEDEKSEE